VDEPAATSSTGLVEDLFRREYAHLVSALTRVLGTSNIPLAEDVVHDALLSAMHAWRFGLPRDPKAWIIRAAHNRAIDIIRREQRHRSLLPELATTADRRLIERGLAHLARSATGDHMSRWHLEAGIACEHAIAPSVRETDWDRIVVLYDLLVRLSPSPVVALNRALALAERDGVDEGRSALMTLASDRKLSTYPFYWAARADLERRAEQPAAARSSYERAIALARSSAERVSYERRLELLDVS
jgi:predicted RNA polymerase sigma factor